MKEFKVFVLLPAFNEETALRQLVPDLVKALAPMGNPFAICVVDDGSTDGTATWVNSLGPEAPVVYLSHEKNQGYGAAIKTGAMWAIQNAQPLDVLITMDADNTHTPATITDMMFRLREGFDVVTASYVLPGGQAQGVPFKRRILSLCANGLLRLRFHFPGVGTYTNGFRAYRVGALQKAYIQQGDALVEETNFAGGTELFIKVLRAGAHAGEVAFTLYYGKRGTGSKIRFLPTITGYLKLLFI